MAIRRALSGSKTFYFNWIITARTQQVSQNYKFHFNLIDDCLTATITPQTLTTTPIAWTSQTFTTTFNFAQFSDSMTDSGLYSPDACGYRLIEVDLDFFPSFLALNVGETGDFTLDVNLDSTEISIGDTVVMYWVTLDSYDDIPIELTGQSFTVSVICTHVTHWEDSDPVLADIFYDIAMGVPETLELGMATPFP